jgi:CPA1 family monovalent cation:H+ antiporter
MSGLDIASACLVATALLAYANHRFVKLPTTIGVMVIALGLSLALLGLDAAGWSTALNDRLRTLVGSIDFSRLLMDGMLSLLLFAGALHVDLRALKRQGWTVGGLAALGTLASTLIVGFGTWWLLPLAGLPLPLPWCLVFGALISPTDPIAVLGIITSAKAPKSLEIVIAGESLFNDGVGVVLYALLLGMLGSGTLPTPGAALQLLLHEAVGGLLFGGLLGGASFLLLRSIDSYKEEVLLTLATVLGGYAFAQHLHVSGPLAMVVAGLIIGNQGRALAMSDLTRQQVDTFWELIDEILNALLFVLIGLEAIVIRYSPTLAAAAALAIAVTLLARALSVGLPTALWRERLGLPPGAATVLTWGGLRGGISVALALALPAGPERDPVVALTYAVVVFSILVQGLTMGRVVRRVQAA